MTILELASLGFLGIIVIIILYGSYKLLKLF